MCHKPIHMPKHIPQNRQQGSMLVVSIFIVVVISLLAASLSRILSSTSDSIVDEVYSAKAYFAADSAMEYGMYQVLRNNQTCAIFPDLATDIPFDISSESGLENCQTTVSCVSIVTDTTNQFYLNSSAICGGDKIVAQHQVEAEITL